MNQDLIRTHVRNNIAKDKNLQNAANNSSGVD